MNGKRLIEVAFSLQQTSLDSVDEKNKHHRHVSTLNFRAAWPPHAAAGKKKDK